MSRTLKDVGPDERGISWKHWHTRELDRICAEYHNGVTPAMKENAPINQKRISTHRDQYGMKGIPTKRSVL